MFFLKMFEKLLGVNVIEKDSEEVEGISNKVHSMTEETKSRFKTRFVDSSGVDHYISWSAIRIGHLCVIKPERT